MADPYLQIGESPRRLSSDGVGMTGSMAELAAGVRCYHVPFDPNPTDTSSPFSPPTRNYRKIVTDMQ